MAMHKKNKLWVKELKETVESCWMVYNGDFFFFVGWCRILSIIDNLFPKLTLSTVPWMHLAKSNPLQPFKSSLQSNYKLQVFSYFPSTASKAGTVLYLPFLLESQRSFKEIIVSSYFPDIPGSPKDLTKRPRVSSLSCFSCKTSTKCLWLLFFHFSATISKEL